MALTASLTVELGQGTVQTLPLDVPVLSIGRLPDNGLPLPHPNVSRHHAEIRRDGDRWLLTDLGSANGTSVGETHLLPNQPWALVDGQSIRIGPFRLRFEMQGAPDVQDVVRAGVPLSLDVMPTPIPEAETPSIVESPASMPLAVLRQAPPRETHLAPLAPGAASSYLDFLPIIYQDSDFLGRYLLLFQTVWEPLEQREDHLPAYFDPRTAPASFLPWLASWLSLGYRTHWPEARLRRLLSEAMDLYRWRGTNYGLARLLELYVGSLPEIIESPEEPYVFRVRLRLPDDGSVSRNLVDMLIQEHKPAHAAYALETVQ